MTTKTNAEESRYAVSEVIGALYDIKTGNLGEETFVALYDLIKLCENDYTFWDNKVKENDAKIDLDDKRRKVISDMAEHRVVTEIKFYDDLAFCYIDARVYKFSFFEKSPALLSYQALS